MAFFPSVFRLATDTAPRMTGRLFMAKYAITAVQPPASVPACQASEDDIPVFEDDIPAWSGLKHSHGLRRTARLFMWLGLVQLSSISGGQFGHWDSWSRPRHGSNVSDN